MSSKDIDFLKSNNIDSYKLLEISNDANDVEIRKAYRRQALIYHPDKNPSPSAAEKFHSISLSLKVLTDHQLRSEYDSWLNSKKLEVLRTEKLDANRRHMKDELEKAENEATSQRDIPGGQKFSWNKRAAAESNDSLGVEIERLRQEGAQKRREFEKQYLSKFEPKVVKKPTTPNPVDSVNDRTVKVRWKIKEGISELFNADILRGIMSVFGEVESSKVLPRPLDSKYDTGLVTFKSSRSAVDSVSHDFSKKSKKWGDTPYRKLSGLLREVKWNKKQTSTRETKVLNKQDLSFENYMDLTLLKLRKAKNHETLLKNVSL